MFPSKSGIASVLTGISVGELKCSQNLTVQCMVSFLVAFNKDMSRLGFVHAGGAVCEGRFSLYEVSCTSVLWFSPKPNSRQNCTRDKILVCKTWNIKWTKFSPEVSEFPSCSMGNEPGFSPFCFTGFTGRAVSVRVALLQRPQLEKLQHIF